MNETLLHILINTPLLICKAQSDFNSADYTYQAKLADVTLEALSAALFDGKDGKRVASNDTERNAAIAKLTTSDPCLAELRAQRDAAHALLTYHRNTLESAQRATRLFSTNGS